MTTRLTPEREAEIRRVMKSRAMADAAWSFTKEDIGSLLREIDKLRKELKAAKEGHGDAGRIRGRPLGAATSLLKSG